MAFDYYRRLGAIFALADKLAVDSRGAKSRMRRLSMALVQT